MTADGAPKKLNGSRRLGHPGINKSTNCEVSISSRYKDTMKSDTNCVKWGGFR